MTHPLDDDEKIFFASLVGNVGDLSLVRTMMRGRPVAVVVAELETDDGPAMLPLALLLRDDLVEALGIEQPICEGCGEPSHAEDH